MRPAVEATWENSIFRAGGVGEQKGCSAYSASCARDVHRRSELPALDFGMVLRVRNESRGLQVTAVRCCDIAAKEHGKDNDRRQDD